MSTLDDVNELPLADPRTWTRRGDRRSDLRQVLEALAHAAGLKNPRAKVFRPAFRIAMVASV